MLEDDKIKSSGGVSMNLITKKRVCICVDKNIWVLFCVKVGRMKASRQVEELIRKFLAKKVDNGRM